MIGRISGAVVAKNERYVIVDAGGVGYKIYATTDTLRDAKTDASLSLWTHLVSREDALELYGFPSQEDLSFFEQLIRVSGVGPRSALAVMGVAPVRTLRAAIIAGDTGYLTKVSGIGKKTAERIAIELKDKLGILEEGETGAEMKSDTDALMALTSLGYTTKDAREALKELPADIQGTNNRIKEALKRLGN